MNIKTLLPLAAVFLLTTTALAEDQAKPKPETKAPHKNVLDFDSEVIEGERKTPDLFLQIQSETTSLDSVLFQRTNFNDFHDLEKKRRPIYRRYTK